MIMFEVLLLIAAYAEAFSKTSMSSPMPTRVTSSSFNASDTSRKVISIIAGVNYGGVVVPLGPMCTEAWRFGLDTMKNMPNFLSKYELVLETYDEQCSRPLTVNRLVNLLRRNDEVSNRFPLTMGTFCSGSYHTGQMLHHFNTIGITPIAAPVELHTLRSMYRSFFVFGPPLHVPYLVLVDFMEMMGWRRVAFIGENSNFYTEHETRFANEFQRRFKDSEISGFFKFVYISGVPPESAHVEAAVAELAALDPRIIVINNVLTVRVACWLHRYKLYGPNYVILTATTTPFAQNDPLRFMDWCTESMLGDVLESTFYFGYSDSMNFGKKELLDSWGVNGTQYEKALMEAIDKVEISPQWWYWRAYCYDNLMVAAHVLNTTDAILSERNETLADWTTNGMRFRSDNNSISDTMKEALYSTDVFTKLGHVRFDAKTTVNSLGDMWLGFFQVRRLPSDTTSAPRRLFPYPIAIFDAKSRKLRLGPEKIQWQTPNGQPPADRLKIIRVELPLISPPAYITLCILAASQIFIVGAFSLQSVKGNSFSILDGFILLGDVLLCLFILVQPRIFLASLSTHCMAGMGFLLLGLFSVIFGHWAKLELAGKCVVRDAAKPSKSTNLKNNPKQSMAKPPEQVDLNTQMPNLRKLTKLYFGFGFLGLLLCVGLLIAWFVADPIVVTRVEVGDQVLNAEKTIAEVQFSYQCEVTFNPASLAVIAIFCVSYIAMFIRASFNAYALRTKRFAVFTDFKALSNCLYGTAGLAVCGGIIAGLIFQKQPNLGRIALSCSVLLVGALNLVIVFALKIATKHNKRPNSVMSAMLTPGASRQTGSAGTQPPATPIQPASLISGTA